MSESMREEFEAWAVSHGFRNEDKKLIKSKDELSCALGTDGNFYYKNVRVMAAWKAWQASRAALCVELPHFEQYDDDMVSGAATAINDCQDAIHAAGVKTK